MPHDGEMHEFTFVSQTAFEFRCVAIRDDKPWGHGLSVKILDQFGETRNRVQFACHPAFAEFAACQEKTTAQLIDIAREKLASGQFDKELRECREAGLALILALQSAEPIPAKNVS